MNIEDFLDKMPDKTKVNFFSNPSFIGIEIAVSRPGWGFGAVTLSYDIAKDMWHLDDECTARDTVVEFFRVAAPQIVDLLYDKGSVKFEPPKDDE